MSYDIRLNISIPSAGTVKWRIHTQGGEGPVEIVTGTCIYDYDVVGIFVRSKTKQKPIRVVE